MHFIVFKHLPGCSHLILTRSTLYRWGGCSTLQVLWGCLLLTYVMHCGCGCSLAPSSRDCLLIGHFIWPTNLSSGWMLMLFHRANTIREGHFHTHLSSRNYIWNKTEWKHFLESNMPNDDSPFQDFRVPHFMFRSILCICVHLERSLSLTQKWRAPYHHVGIYHNSPFPQVLQKPQLGGSHLWQHSYTKGIDNI